MTLFMNRTVRFVLVEFVHMYERVLLRQHTRSTVQVAGYITIPHPAEFLQDMDTRLAACAKAKGTNSNVIDSISTNNQAE